MGNPRPFEGLAGECDIVALRESVPSATAKLTLSGGTGEVTLASVLPGAIAGLVRDEAAGQEQIAALQTQAYGPDPGKDLAHTITWLQSAKPGATLNAAAPDDDTPVLTEVVDAAAPMPVEVHKDFQWWLAEGAEITPQIQQSVEQANQLMMPTDRVQADGIEAAWWVDAGDKAHIRWVRPEDEDELFAALARVHAAGGLTLGEGSRFAGSFRTNGLLVPVFDLDNEMHAQEWADGLVELDKKLNEALAVKGELSSAERSSRDGLRARQVTLR